MYSGRRPSPDRTRFTFADTFSPVTLCVQLMDGQKDDKEDEVEDKRGRGQRKRAENKNKTIISGFMSSWLAKDDTRPTRDTKKDDTRDKKGRTKKELKNEQVLTITKPN